MNLIEFRTLVDTWGGDIARWPMEKQAAAYKLADDPDAAALLTEAQRIDAFLARRPSVSSERALRAAHGVALRVAEMSTPKPRWWETIVPREWMVPATSLACSAVLGVSLALSLPYTISSDQPMVLAMILDSTSLFGGLEVR